MRFSKDVQTGDYYSVQVRVSFQVQQLAMTMARRNGMTMKAWIESAIREHAHRDQNGQEAVGRSSD